MTAWFLTYFGKIFKIKLIVSHQRPNVDLKDPLVIKLPQIYFYFQQCFPHLRISTWLLTTILQDDCRRIKSFFTLVHCHSCEVIFESPPVLCWSWDSCDLPTGRPRWALGAEAGLSSCGTGWGSIWSFNAPHVSMNFDLHNFPGSHLLPRVMEPLLNCRPFSENTMDHCFF